MRKELSKINLNLLIVLDALLEIKHVTKVAKQLYISQSAVSHSLNHLRKLFNDELLVKGPSKKMTLSLKAESLKEPVKTALDRVRKLFSIENVFNPSVEKENFRIGLPDYICNLLSFELLTEIENYFPGITVTFISFNDLLEARDFDTHNLDLLISIDYEFNKKLNNLSKEYLFTDCLICTADKQHPKFQEKQIKLSYESYTSSRFIRLKGNENYPPSLAASLKTLYAPVKSTLNVPYTTIALSLLTNSNYICLLPKKLVEKFSEVYNLTMKEPPSSIPQRTFTVSQYWRTVDNNNPANIWLRKIINRIITGK